MPDIFDYMHSNNMVESYQNEVMNYVVNKSVNPEHLIGGHIMDQYYSLRVFFLHPILC
jgi:hypothetical protein